MRCCILFKIKSISRHLMSEYISAMHLLNPKTARSMGSSNGIAIPKASKNGSVGNIPMSPTDSILSPCSKRLWGKRIHSPDIQYSLKAIKQRKYPCPGKSLILGTSSESRKNVMNNLEWKYSQMSPNIDEKAVRSDSALDLPVEVAKAKASALMARLKREDHEGDSILITTDQIVLFKQQVREKPESEEQAIEYLSSYSNDSVTTVAAVVITHFPSGVQAWGTDLATVYWRFIDDEVVRKVVAKGDVFNSCGGFCIEDPDLNELVKGVDGTMDSVFGLPVDLTVRLINEVLRKCDDFYADVHHQQHTASEGKDSLYDSAVTPTRYRERKHSDDEDENRASSSGGSGGGRFSGERKSYEAEDELMFGNI